MEIFRWRDPVRILVPLYVNCNRKFTFKFFIFLKNSRAGIQGWKYRFRSYYMEVVVEDMKE